MTEALHGILPALVTPLDAEGEFDERGLGDCARGGGAYWIPRPDRPRGGLTVLRGDQPGEQWLT